MTDIQEIAQLERRLTRTREFREASTDNAVRNAHAHMIEALVEQIASIKRLES